MVSIERNEINFLPNKTKIIKNKKPYKQPGDVVEFVYLLSVRYLSISAETLNRFSHG